MKLQLDARPSLNTVTGYGPGFVEINRHRFEHALLLAPEGEIVAWDVEHFESLTPAHFERLLTLAPDVLLLGTGERQRFPHPRLTSALTQARIGVDVMDTRAACRTYNILMVEGRKVLAALLVR